MKSKNDNGSKKAVNFVRLTEDEFNAKVQQSQGASLVKIAFTQKPEVFYLEILQKHDSNNNVASDIERDVEVILSGFGEYQSEKKRFVIYLT